MLLGSWPPPGYDRRQARKLNSEKLAFFLKNLRRLYQIWSATQPTCRCWGWSRRQRRSSTVSTWKSPPVWRPVPTPRVSWHQLGYAALLCLWLSSSPSHLQSTRAWSYYTPIKHKTGLDLCNVQTYLYPWRRFFLASALRFGGPVPPTAWNRFWTQNTVRLWIGLDSRWGWTCTQAQCACHTRKWRQRDDHWSNQEEQCSKPRLVTVFSKPTYWIPLLVANGFPKNSNTMEHFCLRSNNDCCILQYVPDNGNTSHFVHQKG